MIVADDDGVLVVPIDDAPAVAAAARAREASEQERRVRFQAGEIGLDVYGMRATLERLGVTYVDEEETP